MFQNLDPSQPWANAKDAAFIMLVVFQLAKAVKWAVETYLARSKDEQQQETSAENTAFDHLAKLWEMVTKELDKTKQESNEKDAKIGELKKWRDTFEEKVCQARLDFHNVFQVHRELDRFLKESGIDAPKIYELLQESSAKMEEIRECLKQNL